MQKSTQRPKPWYQSYQNNDKKEIIIIGCGICGASSAYYLANLGYNVTLLEKNHSIVAGASGNYQAILYPNFYGSNIEQINFNLMSFIHSYNLIKSVLSIDEYSECGIINLAYNEKILKQQQYLLNSKNYHILNNYIQPISNNEIKNNCLNFIANQAGLLIPNGMWFSPKALINKLLSHNNIKVLTNQEVIAINKSNASWNIICNNGLFTSANIILANAHDINKIELFKNLIIKKIRGQVSLIKANSPVNKVICANGYITPNYNDLFTIGASFKYNADDNIKIAEHVENITNFNQILSGLNKYNLYDEQIVSGRVSFRATTLDYMPIVGPISRYARFVEQYHNLAKDSNYWYDNKCDYLEGIFINVAHGSRGMLTGPISSNIIANYITNQNQLVDNKILQLLHPNRLYVNHLVKGYALI
jgi:tRNA 5-methylaminomethyl-2-thiouridine biosynthesis bifunctional protein